MKDAEQWVVPNTAESLTVAPEILSHESRTSCAEPFVSVYPA